MKKILAFAGSNSSTSINHSLVSYIASQINDFDVRVIKLLDYPLPMFGEDIEREQGYSKQLQSLLETIKEADGLVLSVNEHNGAISAYFKNVLDWLSRIEYKFLEDTKVLLMSTSNGARGGLSAYKYTEGVLPRFNGEVVAGFTFPSFSKNFPMLSVMSREEWEESEQETFKTVSKELSTFLEALNG